MLEKDELDAAGGTVSSSTARSGTSALEHARAIAIGPHEIGGAAVEIN